MKRDPVKDKLDAIAALRGQAHDQAAHDVLRHALSDKSNFVVAAAAEALSESDPAEVVNLLLPAFERFLAHPERTDKGCKAKTAIAAALHRIEPLVPKPSEQKEFFLRGLRYVQAEPAWGGSVDTAVELRATCALGLARLGYAQVVSDLADLLADPERGARAAAARAIGCAGLPEGVPLLRYKALIGDEDPQVLVECFGALLCLDPRGALPFVRRFLLARPKGKRPPLLDDLDEGAGPGDVAEPAEAAALALGHSRLDEALPVLIEYCDAQPQARRRVALLAVSTLRFPAAIEYLLSQVSSAVETVAAQAIEALAVHRYDPTLRPKVDKALAGRSSQRLSEVLRRSFAAPG